MRLGVAGHQRRAGLDWNWLSKALRDILIEQPTPLIGLSALAAGTDQLFAQTVIALGGNHIAVVPLDDYERFFSQPNERRKYRELLALSEKIYLKHPGPDQAAFLAAGQYVVENCDVLIAVWDSRPSEGVGGTADVIDYAQGIGRRIIHIDPFTGVINRSYS